MTPPNDPTQPPAQHRAPIATRAAPPRPRRLSRKALATIAGVSAFGIAAALGYSLSRGSSIPAPQQSVSIERRHGSDLLDGAPRDYGDLAAARAGDIGAPGAETSAPAMPETTPPPTPVAPVDNEVAAAEQRRRQQGESARSSNLFASNGAGARPAPLAEAPIATPPSPPAEQPPAPTDLADRRAAFVAGTGTREPTLNSGRLTAPASRYAIIAGSTIAAALVTGLSSDLPGRVVAQVTEDVFDSATGQNRLIPQGTRLIGNYDARVSTGQTRALVVWTRLILPDGRSLDLDRLVGTDAAGQSGFADRVNNHWGSVARAGVLATLLGLGTELTGFGENDAIADAIRDSAGQTVGRAGDRIVERQLQVQPTITIRPGARVRVLVSRDLILAPWPGA